MKHVYTARDPIDAHLVRDLLEAEGIPAEVRGEIPMTEDTLPSVWVPAERAAARVLSIVHTHQEGAAVRRGAGAAFLCLLALRPRSRVTVWGRRSAWSRPCRPRPVA